MDAIRSKFLVQRLMSVRSRVSVVATSIWCIVVGTASWTEGAPVATLVGSGASVFDVENVRNIGGLSALRAAASTFIPTAGVKKPIYG